MDKLNVSVAICTCNGEKYIREQLESILNQTETVDEIILCDDLSEDNTLKIADEILSDSKIFFRIIQNTPRLGVGKNFVKCISECTGDIVFLSDQDDIWLSDKIRKMKAAFSNPNVVMAFSDAGILYGRGTVTDESLGHKKLGEYYSDAWGKYLADTMARVQKNPNGCLMAIRRDKILPLLSTLPYDWHDGWIMHAAALVGEYVYVNEKLMFYRVHANNLTSSPKAEAEYLQKVNNCSAYDRYFSLHEFRRARIELFERIVTMCKDSNCYIESYKKSIETFSQLQTIKERTRLGRVYVLFKLLFKNLYRYRYIDPVCPQGFIFYRRLAGMFLRDIVYVLKRTP